jgi:hypothetical protein
MRGDMSRQAVVEAMAGFATSLSFVDVVLDAGQLTFGGLVHERELGYGLGLGY